VEPKPYGRHSGHQRGRGYAEAKKAAEAAEVRQERKSQDRRAMRPVRILLVVAVAVASAGVGAGLAINALEKGSNLAASTGASGPLFGVDASSTGALAQAESEFGHMAAVRVYYPGLPSPTAWTTGVPGQAHSAVVVSFNAQPSDILSGSDDAAFRHFFDGAPTGHPIYWSYHPEPEPKIADGLFTLSAYKAAWAHLVALADQAHNPDLQSTLILMSYDLSPVSGRDWKSYLPGGAIISTLGWDSYPSGSVENRDPQLTPPDNFMGAAVAASKSVGLPFGFAEFALARTNGRPAWLTSVGNYLMSVGALFGTYFDSPGWPAMYMTDSPSIAAWRSVVAKSGSSVPLAAPPTPAPTPTPASSGPAVTGLALSPATFAATGSNHATITFTLSQAADVTVCILNKNGTVVHTIAKPSRAAGPVTIGYYGYSNSGKRDLTGQFPVLIVASNSHGSTTAETSLTITAP
jgi:hypothetical protein